ncbi:MAG TPA: hypothetical protein DEB09_05795 [Candidatus Magasanikbacteria bacterium]|nr:hypothetical protein [Candidatus Magasanikbacteria bacterium]
MNKKDEQLINQEKNIPEVKEDTKVNIHVNSNDGLKELIEKNIKWSQVIYEQNKKIKHRLTMMLVASYLKILFILVPLILAFIFLSPMLKGALDQYSNLLGVVNNGGAKEAQINNVLSQVSGDQINEVLKMLGNNK